MRVTAICVLLGCLSWGCRAGSPGSSQTKPSGDEIAAEQAKHNGAKGRNVVRGVAWDANWRDRAHWYGTKNAERSLVRLKQINANWIAVTPFSYQPRVDEPRIRFREGWSRGLDKDIRNAHRLGIKVLLKPHIWSNQFWDGSGNWRGTIKMSSEAEWAKWFDYYERWIVHVAKQAAAAKADAFCVGLEYVKSSRAYAGRWRAIIRAVRRVFSGPLTYGAHTDELDLPFWDELDAIGINAYFPIASSSRPTIGEMEQRWRAHGARLAALAKRYRKQVVFTEVGYASIDGAAREPFRWPTAKDRRDLQEQANAYRALFNVAPSWPWFGGMFIWKYKIGGDGEHGSPSERHFVFQGKPAEHVIKSGFERKYARD
ncbi:MAG: hypothetical protein KC503_19800 [Myxococcales bacterium]|nr:hypothetical protein [Myxococcales bacterium]